MRGRQRIGRVWGLCRVSSQRQDREGTSLDGQQTAIGRWCSAQGLAAPTYLVEVESGAAEKAEAREGLQQILREAREGDTVVVYAVDRWSRDLVYTMQSVRALTARGVRWYAIRESLDAATREGDDRLGLMAWIAENERKRIRERTIGRKLELQDAGFYMAGRPPVGYVLRDRRLVPGPDAEVVREAFRRCAAGEGLDRIAQTLPLTSGFGKQGARRAWDKSGLHRLLRRRHYLGESERSDGTWHPTHEPLVDRDLWERARAAMTDRRRGGRRPGDGFSAARLLRGIATCSLCGRREAVTLGRPRAKGGRAMAYVCAGRLAGQCRARHVHAERLDALADAAALRRLVELRRELAAVRPEAAPEPPAEDHAEKIRAAKKRRERLITLAVDGAITGDDLKVRLAKLDAEIGKLETAAGKARRAAAAAAKARRPEVRAEVLGRVETLADQWARLPVEARRDVLAMLADRIEVVPAPRAHSHDVVPPRIRWRSVEDLTADR